VFQYTQSHPANHAQDLPDGKSNAKDSNHLQVSMEHTKATPVIKASSTSKEDFTIFLRKLLNGCTTDWKTSRTAEDARVCHQAVLDAMNQLEDLSWAKTGGGYQIPEGECWLWLKLKIVTSTL
jgi:biopolymer transport protein ExbD